jgi:hypothetical protein
MSSSVPKKKALSAYGKWRAYEGEGFYSEEKSNDAR